MKVIRRDYKVTNALMGPDYRFTAVGAQTLAQDCFAVLMAHYHVAAFDLRHRSLMWIISEFSMHFDGEMPFWGETVTIELWLSGKPSVKVYADYRISHKGRVFCTGDSIWAILDISSRKPAVAADILSQVDCGQEPASGIRRHKLPLAGNTVITHRHQTNISDTDFNSHVSNITYMKVCRNAMPQDYLSAHTMTDVDMKFQREAFLGRELTCRVAETATPDSWIYTITDDSGTVCCQAAATYIQSEPDDRCPDNLDIRKG